MPLRVILTAGLNELPLLISSYAVCREQIAKDAGLPEFSILSSPETKEEAERVRVHLMKKLKVDRLVWDVTAVSDAHNPESLSRGMKELLDRIGKQGTLLDLHYTGGTAAMGVHAIRQIYTQTGVWPRLSYVSSADNRVRDESGREFGGDERFEWDLKIGHLADLHGFEVFQEWDPDDDLQNLGSSVMELLKELSFYEVFRKWSGQKIAKLRQIRQAERDPREFRRLQPVVMDWKMGIADHPRAAAWNALIDQSASVLTRNFVPEGEDLVRVGRDRREALDGFLNNGALELTSFKALQDALRKQGILHFTDVKHSVKCRYRPKPPRPGEKTEYRQPFELDVTAVCGYELLVVSCGMTIEEKAKQKGFEAAHRARQIGGGQARAVVVCMDTERDASSAEAGLRDDVGGREKYPRIWGKNATSNVKDLSAKFVELFEEMRWGK